MKICLIGYGRMGKEIEAMIKSDFQDLEIGFITDNDQFTAEDLKGNDVAIEFSMPESAISNYSKCFEADIPVVSGTTGWMLRYEEVRNFVRNNKKAMFYAPNFSIGVNLFFELNKHLANLMNGQNYDLALEEIHHTAKIDKPSGTAIHLATDIIHENADYDSWSLNEGQASKSGEMLINAKREEKIPGTHIVSYKSAVDSIEIKHTAFSRKGFANGAILAAKWVKGKTGFFEMKDMLKF